MDVTGSAADSHYSTIIDTLCENEEYIDIFLMRSKGKSLFPVVIHLMLMLMDVLHVPSIVHGNLLAEATSLRRGGGVGGCLG